VKALQPADVINVRVGADNGFDGEAMLDDEGEDAIDFVTRVDDNGFARGGIADDVAIALQNAHGQNFVDEGTRARLYGHCVVLDEN
jgi:hypothetical protein